MGFDDTPEELLVHIFRFLPLDIVGRSCALVSKFWKEASGSDVLWNYFLVRDGLETETEFQSGAMAYYKDNCTLDFVVFSMPMSDCCGRFVL